MSRRTQHYESAFEHYLRARRIPHVCVDEARRALLPQPAPARAPAPEVAQGAPQAVALKSFDFVVYSRPRNFLVDIKGRKIARRAAPPRPTRIPVRAALPIGAHDPDQRHLFPGVPSPAPASYPAFDESPVGARTTVATPPRKPRRATLDCWVTQEDIRSLGVWQSLFGPEFVAVFVFMFWCDDQPPDGLFQELLEHQGRWYAIRAVTLDQYAAHMRQRSPRWGTVHVPPADFERISAPFCG